ncbi:MAG TPA: thiamine pyrophosphate-dependent enzyme [Saprospiraceae bacterium]|nr:thiamine pyrophosphate-dependent enzyme [Saprospiraceae bacterium]HMQ85398.1 thiamine pyrophosphate-dependent enzyme [Saprospiraceae bacterium]
MPSSTMSKKALSASTLKHAFRLMATAKAMTDIYEANMRFVSKYVHATSRGHEAIQLAVSMQLLPQDFLCPYYRDDAMLLGIGMRPYELMLQLMTKRDDPFSGGRTYYCHPSLKDEDKPKIPHQSSATGMQAIPATGIALGLQYKEKQGFPETATDPKPLVVCTLGDASVTEGEVAEAFQMAALKQLPIIFLVEDNGWDISASADEVRAQNAAEYAAGFVGLEAVEVDGSDFSSCYTTMQKVIQTVRRERRPFLVRADVPLLNHHTSGVRKETYRDDLEEHAKRDPYPIFRNYLEDEGVLSPEEMDQIEAEARLLVVQDFEAARQAEDPRPEDLYLHDFAPTPILQEQGQRAPAGSPAKIMVDCALFAVEELLQEHPECLLYGQDVGRRLGGVFREAATLAEKFGDDRVFNTPIQEAFIIGSTVGMSAAGLKPIVEVQFADYIWPGLNQLFTEVSRSSYLSNGKWPVGCIIRVPIGAYGGGGPFHSTSVESVLTNIKGIKIAYPSNGADLKGLMKAAYYDPNPVIMLEHKGLYWSKVKGTEGAKTILPDKDYVLPFGKARTALEADAALIEKESSLAVITYGMGVYWALEAAKAFPGRVAIIDLRTLFPLDEAAVFTAVKTHNRALVVTEEPVSNTFAQSLAARIQEHCFEYLDAPVRTIGSENLPAIPLNETLEKTMVLSAAKVQQAMAALLDY